MTISFTGAHDNRLVGDDFFAGDEAGRASAPTALLMHGGGQTRHAWGGTAERLAGRGWRAIALDQRGHGESDWLACGAYGFRDFGADARCVAQALTGEGGPAPVAIGASLGGLAAILALGDDPDAEPCFRALVLVDIVPQMDPRGVDRIQSFMMAHAREGFATIDEAADAVARYLPHRPRPRSLDGLRKNLRRADDGRWYWHWDPAFLDGPGSVNADWRESEAALHRCARAIRVPVLLVRGGSSELVTPEAAQAFRELVPHAEFIDVAQARHMVAGDRNDIFSNAVETFLGRLDHAI